MILIDTHAHLTFKSFKKDLDQVINRAKEAGLVAVIDSAIDPRDFKKALDLLNKHRNFVFLAIGAAPQTLTEKDFEATLEILEKYHNMAVAVGEIGLDYYWVKDERTREFTRKAFRELVRVALELDKPIVIHNRDAFDDVVRILSEERAERVVFHAFMESIKKARIILEKGWYLSIPTMVYRLSGLQGVVKKLPLDRFFLETDSPYLAPLPRTRNEPANVKYSAEIIGKVKGIPADEVAYITSQNAINFFDLNIKIDV